MQQEYRSRLSEVRRSDPIVVYTKSGVSRPKNEFMHTCVYVELERSNHLGSRSHFIANDEQHFIAR
eukprot:COSAG02_NODE_955_length_15680_cov_31.906681_3_plen_66_part_00